MTMRRAPLLNTTEDGTLRLALRHSLDRRRVSRVLRDRLDEKIRNYDREAARLEIRGQHDAAGVLRKAAEKLRGIRRNAQPEEVGA